MKVTLLAILPVSILLAACSQTAETIRSEAPQVATSKGAESTDPGLVAAVAAAEPIVAPAPVAASTPDPIMQPKTPVLQAS
jgi:UTP-glucose-1-phosphate uridylyltransferase